MALEVDGQEDLLNYVFRIADRQSGARQTPAHQGTQERRDRS